MFNAISTISSLHSSTPLSPLSEGGLLNIPSALDRLMPKGAGETAKAEVLDDWCGTKPHPFPFPPPAPPLGGGLLGPGQLGNLIGEVLGPGGNGGGMLGPGQLGNLIGDVLGPGGNGGGMLGPGQVGSLIGELLGGGGGRDHI